MYNSKSLVDLLKARYDLPSDYSVAQKLGCSRSFIYEIRSGRRNLGFDYSLKIADMLGLDTIKVIASAGYEISMSKKQLKHAKLWLKYANDKNDKPPPTKLAGQLSPHLSTT